MTNLDTLQQRASDNYAMRRYQFLDIVRISADAMDMGDGAVSSVAHHSHYKKNSLKKLSVAIDLPEEALNPDVMPGAYWVAFLADATPEQVTKAVEAGVETPAQMKKFLGVESERGPVCIDCPVCGARFER